MACGRRRIDVRMGLEGEDPVRGAFPSSEASEMTVVRLFGVLVVALAALLVLTAAPVSAKQIHTFSTSFGAPASDTTLSLTAGSGLAVNETSHDIYIADTGNRRIVELTAAGAFVRAFGADVGGAGVDVCTASCQPGNNGTSPGSFEMPTFLAIDNSGGASSGNVYVMDSATNVISKFKADGTLVSTWGNNGAFEAANGQLAGKTQAELFTGIAGIAIDSAGTLAVLETSSQLLTFTEGGSFIGEIAAPRGSAALGLSVDGDGNFFKANGDLTIQRFAPSGASIGQITAEAAQATGFASNPASGVLYADFGAFINAYAFNGAGEVINPAGSCAPQEFAGCPGPNDLPKAPSAKVAPSRSTAQPTRSMRSTLALPASRFSARSLFPTSPLTLPKSLAPPPLPSAAKSIPWKSPLRNASSNTVKLRTTGQPRPAKSLTLAKLEPVTRLFPSMPALAISPPAPPITTVW